METTTGTPAPAAATGSPFATLEGFNRILTAMSSASATISDIIFSPGRPPQVEMNSQLRAARIPGLETLTAAHTAEIAKLLTNGKLVAMQTLESHGAADVSYAVGEKARFRVNVFKQRGQDRK